VPWKTAPPEIRERVNRALGGDIYAMAHRAWERAIAADPQAVVGRFFSTPEQHFRLPGAAKESQHLLGLAVDVTASEGRKAALLEALKREGFWVQTYPKSRHIHAQAMNPQEFAKVRAALVAAGFFRPR
jgi:hypothetical protein